MAVESAAVVIARWVGKPISAPDNTIGRSLGGRLTHYRAVEIVDPVAVAAPSANLDFSISVNDIVEVARKHSGPILSEGHDEPAQPFLAQVEAFWEDSFTGIAHCRVRWLLRASEVVGDVADDEVLLTTVTNNIDATAILGLAPMNFPAPAESEPHGDQDSYATAARQGPRAKRGSGRKGRGRKAIKNVALELSREYDPFAEEFNALPTDHPALSRLRERGRAVIAARELEGGGGGGRGGGGSQGQPGRSATGCSSSHGSPAESLAHGRAGVERKGLSGVRLVVVNTRVVRGRGGSSGGGGGDGGSGGSSSESSIHSAGSSSASVDSSSGGSSRGSTSGGFTSGDSEDDLQELAAQASTSIVTTRRQRRGRSAPPSLQQRSRRLSMPPSEASLAVKEENVRAGASKPAAKDATETANARKGKGKGSRSSIFRGGPLIRAAHVGEESEQGKESPKATYPHREADVGEEHQADIPAVLTAEERAMEKAGMETGELGGTLVWNSVRDWKEPDRNRLDEYLRQARRAMEARQFMPGVPVVVSINNSGDRRRKRKMAWAVIAGGKVEEGKVCVACAGKGVLEVPKEDVRPIQAEEVALEALMKDGDLADLRPALNIISTRVDDSGPLAVWTAVQIDSLVEALDSHFDQDRYLRSRGQDRYRDEHTDLASLSVSVPAKSPCQVLSFYYRYMATGDALTDLLGGPEAARKSRETKVVRPRTPPPPRPSPPPNLRHRPSLRCPTRLAQQQETDSDSGGSSQPRRSAAHEGGRRGAGKGAKKTVITANGVRGGGGDGGEAAKQQAIQEIPKPGVGVAVARGMEGADSYGRTRPASSGRTVEETYDGRSVPWGQEKAASAEGGGRGYKRSLEDGAVERAKQRPRKLEAPRPEIPADAVIVEVLDDDEPPAFDPHGGANGSGGGLEERRVGRPGARERAETKARPGMEAGAGGEVYGERLARLRDDGLHPIPRRKYPPREEKPYPPPPASRNKGYGGRGSASYDDPRRHNQRYTNPRYSDRRYPDECFVDDRYNHDPRFTLGRHPHSSPRGNPNGGGPPGRDPSPLDSQPRYPAPSSAYLGEPPYTGRGGGNGNAPTRSPRQHYQRYDSAAGQMEYCWQLVDYARRTGLDQGRVAYLQGLLDAHEKQNMTYGMLVERLESALYDRPKILGNFVRLVSLMDLPQSRRPYRPAPPQEGDPSNGNGYRGEARSGLKRASRYPPGVSSRDYRDEGMERVAAAVTVSKAGARTSDRGRVNSTSRRAGAPAVALASDMRMLGVGTSMGASSAFSVQPREGPSAHGRLLQAGVGSAHRSAAGGPGHGAAPIARAPEPLLRRPGSGGVGPSTTTADAAADVAEPPVGPDNTSQGSKSPAACPGKMATPAPVSVAVAAPDAAAGASLTRAAPSSTAYPPPGLHGASEYRAADAQEDAAGGEAGNRSPVLADAEPPAPVFSTTD